MNEESENATENGKQATRIVMSDLFTYIVGLVTLATLIFVGIFAYQNRIDSPRDAQIVMKQNRLYKNLQKEDYITTSDFNKLFKQAAKYNNYTLIKQMNGQRVVDSNNGKSYTVQVDVAKKVPNSRYKLVKTANKKRW